MYKYFSILFLFLIVIACDNIEPKPLSAEETAKGFIEALKAHDFEKARSFGTKETQKSLLDFETNLKMVSEEEKATLLRGFDIDINKVECQDQQGVMNCNICCSPDGTEASIDLVERDGVWSVQMDLGI